MASFLQSKLEQSWYGQSIWTYSLFPITWLFQLLSFVRKKVQSPQSLNVAVPVVVIGNIAVGGTGKTPLIIALAKQCLQRGLKPGIISRGYGSQAPHYPFAVGKNSSVLEAGDEPFLIAKATDCPVVISPDRNDALEKLLLDYSCDLVLSDDGLQHYKLARTFEVAVIDGRRGLGNGFCLPVGPLRESPRRLQSVDSIVINGPLQKPDSIPSEHFSMTLKTELWRRVIDDKEGALEILSAFDKVHAVTGIGNPQRFFSSLRESNIELIEHAFSDHHLFSLADIQFNDDLPVVMTEKDAVKCQTLLHNSELTEDRKNSYWYLPVAAQLPDSFYDRIISSIKVPMANNQINSTEAQA